MLARTLGTFAVVLVLPAIADAERWPTRSFTTADGLAHNAVHRIVQDSRGFVWFCTREGLSRFDGDVFVTYGTDDGLPSATVNDLLEARDGSYWVATGRGLVRFDPTGVASSRRNGKSAPMFTPIVPPASTALDVTVLLEDSDGDVWVGTLSGLFRVSARDRGTPHLVETDVGLSAAPEVLSLAGRSSDQLWIGTGSGLCVLVKRAPTGCHTTRHGLPGIFVKSLLEDRDGRVWVGTADGGLALVSRDRQTGVVGVSRVFNRNDGLASTWINDILQTTNGHIWIGTSAGIARLVPDGSGSPLGFQVSAVPLGIVSGVLAIAEDRAHHLWIGTQVGAARTVSDGFTVFAANDGVPAASSLMTTPGGEIVAMTAGATSAGAVRLTQGRFTSMRLPLGAGETSWGWNQMMLIDREGDWWIGTRSGVLRVRGGTGLDRLDRQQLVRRYSQADGLASDVVIRIFEDSRGDVWIATVGEGRASGLARWERAANRLHQLAAADGLPDPNRYFVSAFAEDRAGHVWIGLSNSGGLARFKDGRITAIADDNTPVGTIRNLLLAGDGTLWAATTRSGLLRVASPTEDRPAVSRVGVADGLSSNDVGAIVEDHVGRIYAGTARAIDCLDLRSGQINRQRYGDGLPPGEIYAALKDPDGNLWFGSSVGLVRLVPGDNRPSEPASIVLESLIVNGQIWHLSAVGQTDVERFALPPGRATIQVGYVAPGLGAGDVRYQLMLEGVDRAWGPPVEQRTASFVNIGSGRYRFLVRAVNSDGVVSRNVAGFAFQVLTPVWQRWWFITASLTVLAAAAYALSRYRLARLLHVAEMRARITTDLHDDIGANLTRIAVLSEVVRRQRSDDREVTDARLASIATVARESMSAMSDIVWTISPERDRLDELTRRMREYAEEVFTAKDVTLTYNVPDGDAIRLAIDVRRDCYLFFKEAVSNAARHSNCSAFQVDMRIAAGRLELVLADDGVGFDSEAVEEGNGLESMRRRAARLGGQLTIASRPGRGTQVRLEIPLARSRHPTGTGR